MSVPFDVMCVGEVVFVSLSTRCNHINCIKCSISQLTPLISLFKFFVRNEFFLSYQDSSSYYCFENYFLVSILKF
jgi:hypothetical protein